MPPERREIQQPALHEGALHARTNGGVHVPDEVLGVGHQPKEAGDPVAEEDERKDDARGADGLRHPELLQGALEPLPARARPKGEERWNSKRGQQQNGKARRTRRRAPGSAASCDTM